MEVGLQLSQYFLPHIGRIAYHHIEPTAGENFGERLLPTERIYLTIPSEVNFIIIIIHTYEAVAAADVLVEAGQHPLIPEGELLLYGSLGLAFEALQQEAKLGDFHGIGIDVDSVNMGC